MAISPSMNLLAKTIDHGFGSLGGNMPGEDHPNSEFAKWMARWSEQIQQHNLRIDQLRQKQTVESKKHKYPDEELVKISRPKAA